MTFTHTEQDEGKLYEHFCATLLHSTITRHLKKSDVHNACMYTAELESNCITVMTTVGVVQVIEMF